MVIFYHTSTSFYPNGQSLYDLVYHMLRVLSEKNGKIIAVVKIVINGMSGICNNSSVYCAKVLACLKGTCTEMCPTLAKGCKCVCDALEDVQEGAKNTAKKVTTIGKKETPEEKKGFFSSFGNAV